MHSPATRTARVRSSAALAAAIAVLLTLTACAPPVHHIPKPGSLSTAKPRITPTHTTAPVVNAKPASDYMFGCSDLVSAAALPSLFSVPMQATTGAQFLRFNGVSGMPYNYYVEELGGLDCAWFDGKTTNDGATAATSSHDMQLSVLPVDPSVWDRFVQSAGTGATSAGYTECSSDSGYNSCQYDAYVKGSWYELDSNNMSPVPPSETAMPSALQTIVTTLNGKLNASAAAKPDIVQHGTRPLPAQPQDLLTAAEVKTALGLPSSVTISIDCGAEGDGPWTIQAEAATEVAGGGCNFDTPDGGTYGGYSTLAGGEWAAHDAEANTPGETEMVTLNQPQTSSQYSFVDSQGNRTDDLIYDGSWLDFSVFSGDSSEPAGTATPSDALQSLARAAESAIG
jgi:hypothetical protein